MEWLSKASHGLLGTVQALAWPKTLPWRQVLAPPARTGCGFWPGFGHLDGRLFLEGQAGGPRYLLFLLLFLPYPPGTPKCWNNGAVSHSDKSPAGTAGLFLSVTETRQLTIHFYGDF